MRSLGLAAALLALLGLGLITLFRPARLSSRAYHWLLFFCLLVLPGIALTGTITSVMEETKTVKSCGSCHVMQPFVNDMIKGESRTLAARHYQNRWIPQDQCYTCHSTYGLHGSFVAKSTAIRHWLLYVTGTWGDPIQHNGPYPNANCLACHANAQRFANGASHRALAADLATNRVSCLQCHGPPHPGPADRQVTEQR